MFVVRTDDPSGLPTPRPNGAHNKPIGGKPGLAGHRSSSVLSDVSNKLSRIAAMPSQMFKQNSTTSHKALALRPQPSPRQHLQPQFQEAGTLQVAESASRPLAAMKPLPKAQPSHKAMKKKKRTGRKVPVVQGYVPVLSPLMENAWGELLTPAREKIQRELQSLSGDSLIGKLDFNEPEVLVSTATAHVGQSVQLAKQFASEHAFQRFRGCTGVIVRKSETPGGGGCIVDFGERLGRQFLSTGGSGVFHLAVAPPSSSAPARATAPPTPSGLGALGQRAAVEISHSPQPVSVVPPPRPALIQASPRTVPAPAPFSQLPPQPQPSHVHQQQAELRQLSAQFRVHQHHFASPLTRAPAAPQPLLRYHQDLAPLPGPVAGHHRPEGGGGPVQPVVGRGSAGVTAAAVMEVAGRAPATQGATLIWM